MPKIVDAALQRRQICEAARQVFARRGVVGTGLTHVAKAAGMGRSSLYHYYPDKPTLLRDLARQLLDDELAVFVAVLRGDGAPGERVERLARGMVTLFDEYAASFRMVFDLRLRDAGRFKIFFRKIRKELAAVIAEGQAQGEFDAALDPALAASTLIGAIDGLLFQHFADGRAFPQLDALGDELVRISRKGLAA
jgi:AcrR family transcriptional regulator